MGLRSVAFDKLELEWSPLTAAMLDRKRPDICWQVFYENRGKFGGLGKPIEYFKVGFITFRAHMINYNLKPNSSNSMVNQFLHPYNYEEALSFIEELFHLQMNLNALWHKRWVEYLANIPNYNITNFRLDIFNLFIALMIVL